MAGIVRDNWINEVNQDRSFMLSRFAEPAYILYIEYLVCQKSIRAE